MPRLIDRIPNEVFDQLVAVALNVVFEALILLLLWPLGKIELAFRLANGYGIFWLTVSVLTFFVIRIQHIFRINLYDRGNAFLAMNLAASVVLVVGWSAFAALTISSFVGGTPFWLVAVLWIIGFVSSFIACLIVGSFYMGHLYKFVSLPLALASFLVFAIWPAIGQALYGWFFTLF